MQNQSDLDVTHVFGVLAGPRRLAILNVLRAGPLTIPEIATRVGTGFSYGIVRASLDQLRRAGLISVTLANTAECWSLNAEQFSTLSIYIANFMQSGARNDCLPPQDLRELKIWKNRKLLISDHRKTILAEVIEKPTDVGGIYANLKEKISRTAIQRALDAFECEGLVESKCISSHSASGQKQCLLFTATDLARSVMVYVRAGNSMPPSLRFASNRSASRTNLKR